jgi:hypothetical protein
MVRLRAHRAIVALLDALLGNERESPSDLSRRTLIAMGRSRQLAVTLCLGATVACLPATALAAGRTVLPGLSLKLVPTLHSRTVTGHACQNQSRDRRLLRSDSAAMRISRNFSLVACDQPPKSELAAPQTLSHAVSAALVADG